VHPEAVLLVDDRQGQIAERDILLEHRVGADEDMDVAEGQPPKRIAALGPRSRPVRMATLMPAAAASGATVLKCWRAKSSVGAIRAACRPASTTAAAASNATTSCPSRHRPAAAAASFGFGEIGDDLGDGARFATA